MSPLYTLSLTQLRDLLQDKKISAQEVAAAYVQRIENTEPQIQALLHHNPQEVLAQAKKLDAQGPDAQKPLWGVPIIISDNLNTQDMPTTAGSKILQNFMPPQDAHCVAKLKNAGALLMGKANVDEFGLGAWTKNSAYKTTKNPWNPDYYSGGSAASLATQQGAGALGIDTQGCIRQAASACALVGLKPSYGRISRQGLIACASSLDQTGILTRTVADAALMLQIMAGHDPKDATSSTASVPSYAPKEQDHCQGLRLGVPQDLWTGLPLVQDKAKAILEWAQSLGAQVVPLTLNHLAYADLAAYILLSAEASSNLARFDGVRYGHRSSQAQDLDALYTHSRSEALGSAVQSRILFGTYALSAERYQSHYQKAAQIRRLVHQDFLNAWTSCDLILAPMCTTTAMEKIDHDYLPTAVDKLQVAVNLSGLPALTLPLGLNSDQNLPWGLQVIGQYMQEQTLLQVASMVEKYLPAMTLPQ